MLPATFRRYLTRRNEKTAAKARRRREERLRAWRRHRWSFEQLEARVTPSTILTDKPVYAPTETATIQLGGFQAGETVVFQIFRTDGDTGLMHASPIWLAVDGGAGDADGVANGQLTVHYTFPADARLDSFLISAAGNASHLVAQTTVWADSSHLLEAEDDADAPPATTTTVSSSALPSDPGQPVIFTATVNSASPVNTGTVQFLVDGFNLGDPVAVVNGVATSDTITTLTPGEHSVTAVYTDTSDTFDASTGALTQTANDAGNPGAAVTTVAISANTNKELDGGQTASFTAAVTSAAGAVNSGTVQFFIDGEAFGDPVAVVDGVAASDQAPDLDPGGHTITANYSDDTGAFQSSGSVLVYTVVWADVRPKDVAPGQVVTIVAGGFQTGEVVDVQVKNLTTGQVYAPFSVTDGGAGDLDGAADGNVQTVWVVPASALASKLQVTLTGEDTGLSAEAQFSDALNTTTTVTSSQNPSGAGKSVTLTATVTTPSAANVGANFNGINSNNSNGTGSSCNCQPPDTIIAAGPVNVIEAVNTAIKVSDKSGNQLSFQSMSSFFSSVFVSGHSLSDPFAYYDENISNGAGNPSGRFIVGMLEINSSTTVDFLDLAVSNDWDATHGFGEVHQINVGNDGSGNFFADYPRVGFNADALIVTFNMFSLTAGTFQHAQIWTASLSSLTDQNNATFTTFHSVAPTSPLYFTMAPAVMHTPPSGNPATDPAYLVVRGTTTPSTQIFVIKMTNVLSNTPTLTSTTVTVPSYSNAVGATQPGSGGLFPATGQIDFRILNAAWRNNELVADQTIRLGTTGNTDQARWYQFDTSGATPALTMSGNIAPGTGISTMYPSIDIDPSFDLGMTYMETSSTEFVSMYVTGRRPTDAAGVMSAGTLVAAGNVTYSTTTNRGGDFSGTSVDPANGSFWSANEFSNSNVSVFWSTQVANYTIGVASVVNSGSVVLQDGGTTLATLAVSGGSVNLTTSALAAGSHVITATYTDSGSTFNSSFNTLVQTVNGTNTTVSSSTNPSTYGQSVSFTANVTQPLTTATAASGYNGLLSSDSNPTSINGTGSCNCQPPDTIVAAGPVNVVEMVNTAIEWRTKAGVLIQRQKLAGATGGFFSGLGLGSNSATDPFVIFDENISNGAGNPMGRFIVGMLDYSAQTSTDFLDVAVSNDWDATHGWTEMHRINVGAEGTSNGFADYPRIGYNADGFFVTFNMFALTTGQPYQHVQVFVMQLASLIDQNNGTFVTNHFDEPDPNLFTLAPAAMHGAPNNGVMYFVTEGDTAAYTIDVIKLTNYLSGTPAFVDTNLAVSSYAQPTAAPQQGGSYSPQIDSRILNAAWRNNILVADHTVFDAGADHAQWYQFSTSGATPSLTMMGDIAPGAGVYTMYPGIDIDANNNLGLTYMESSATEFVSMYVTGRTATDPAGTMAAGVRVAAGGTTTTNTRGGDYAGMSVDPATGTSFWAANEFFNNAISTSWSTFVSNFTVAAGTSAVTTGAVQFVVDGVNFGSPVSVSGGTATSSAIATLAAGGHSVFANYASGSNALGDSAASLTQTVNAAATSTSVVSSVNPSTFGQSVFFTATVSNTSGTGVTPTGSVQFIVDGVNFGGLVALNASGVAISGSTNSLSAGNHTVTVNYLNSDGNFTNSSGSLAGGQQVNAAATSTSVASSANPSVFGQSVFFTATVTNTSGTGVTPTGSVQFVIDGVNFGGVVALNAGGVAVSGSTSTLGAGNHVITVSYLNSDGNFTNSNGSLAGGQQVNAADTTTSLTVTSATNPNPAFTYGNALTFTATVTANAPSGAVVNTGSVTFYDGATALATVNVNASGVATFSTTAATPRPAGAHTFNAVYSDGTSFNGSSNSKSATITPAPLWVTANSYSKAEGGTLTLTGNEFTLAGPAGSRTTTPILFDSDSVTSVTLTSAGLAAGAEDGSYAITASAATGSGLSNYAITYVSGTLTVLETPINVSLTALAPVNEGDPSATVEVATFTHANGIEAPGHFTASVDWGVAGHHADAATISEDGGRVYHVMALRPVFTENGGFTIAVHVSDADGGANIGQNFSGLSANDDIAVYGSFFIPPDQGSAVGPNHYMELINLIYAIYNKDGSVAVPRTPLSTFFANAGIPGLGTAMSDPRIVYDQASGRWFVVVITTESNSNSILVAVSQTSDPTAGWKAAKFVANATANNFADYPTIAIDANALYVASNNFLNGTTFDGVSLTTIPKADLLNPAGPVVANRSHFENIVGGGTAGTQPFTFAPVSAFDGRPYGVILAADGFTPGSVIHSYRVLNPGSNSATLTADSPIGVPTYWSNQNAHQPDGSRTLNSTDFRFGSNNVYQFGNVIWVAQSILPTSATGNGAYDAVRWYEIDASTNTLLQSGTISDPHHDFLFPSIAADAAGDVVIGFTVTGDSTTGDYAGAWYVAGTTTGGVTTFGAPVAVRNGSSNYNITSNGRNRWGDFSAISVDPNNPSAFWIADEAAVPGDPAFTTRTQVWGTQIAEIQFGNSNSGAGSITVAEPPINAVASSLGAIRVGQSSAVVEVATFTHANGVELATDFTATVDWGIAGHHADAATISEDGGGTYHVSATRPVFTTSGTYTVHVAISEDDVSTSVDDSQAVIAASTSTAVSTTLSPSIYGQSVTFTALVSVLSPGSGTPTGTVTFTIDGVNQAPVALSGNQATFTTSSLAAGNHTVSATYNGDGNFAISTGSLSGGQSVTPAVTSTSVSSSVNPSVYGQSIYFTAFVSNASGTGPTPTGSVQFIIDGVNFGGPVALNGSGVAASGATSALLTGNHTVTVSFVNSDGNFSNSSASLSGGQQVNKDPTTTTAGATPASSSFGQAVTFNATVSANPPGSGTPTGSVDFYDTTFSMDLGLGTLSGGHASLTNSTLAVGTHTIVVTYGGDSNFLTSNTTITVTVGAAAYILDPTANGSLSMSGNGVLNLPGVLVIDSSSATALLGSGNAALTAAGINIVGGYSWTSHGALNLAPATGVPFAADPLAGLVAPSGGTFMGAVSYSSGTHTISPGIYSSITLSSSASLVLRPGVYVIAGGGISVSGSASITTASGFDPVTGHGVLIYNAGSNFPGTGGTFGGISLSGTGTVQLTAPDQGVYGGIVIFQSRDNARAISLSGQATALLSSGTIYAKNALLAVSGQAHLIDSVVVDRLQISGNGTGSMSADGSGEMLVGLAGELASGDLYVYVSDPSGYFSADALARIHDAIAGLDTLLAPYNVTIVQVNSSDSANVILDDATNTAAGGYADGVLGCYVFDSTTGVGEITIVQGWSLYTGSDAAGIAAGQYDFQTVVTHELGHALGLGHNIDGASVMHATLAGGAVRRTMTAADLNIGDTDGGADGLHAAPSENGNSDVSVVASAEQGRVPGANAFAAPAVAAVNPAAEAGLFALAASSTATVSAWPTVADPLVATLRPASASDRIGLGDSLMQGRNPSWDSGRFGRDDAFLVLSTGDRDPFATATDDRSDTASPSGERLGEDGHDGFGWSTGTSLDRLWDAVGGIPGGALLTAGVTDPATAPFAAAATLAFAMGGQAARQREREAEGRLRLARASELDRAFLSWNRRM